MFCCNCCDYAATTTLSTTKFCSVLNTICNGTSTVISTPVMTGRNVKVYVENPTEHPILLTITYMDTNNISQSMSYTILCGAYFDSTIINRFTSASITCINTTICSPCNCIPQSNNCNCNQRPINCNCLRQANNCSYCNCGNNTYCLCSSCSIPYSLTIIG